MHKQHLSITDCVALTGGCGDVCHFASSALSRVDCSRHMKLNPCLIPCRYAPEICAVTNTNWTSHKNFMKLLHMCDASIQKQVLHITSVQFPLHDCHSVGIFIWKFIVLQKGKRSRDLIACCHGNGHGQLHGPERRNCPAMRSEPPPWSCKLLEALLHRNKSLLCMKCCIWLLYSHSKASHYSWPVHAKVTALGRAGYIQSARLGRHGMDGTAPQLSHSGPLASAMTATSGSSSAAQLCEYLLLPD